VGGGGGAGGFTVSVAVRVAPPKAPLIVTDVDAVTAVVPTEKFALSAPAATVTLAGTLATVALLLDSVTIAPPVGAAVVSVTVPVLVVPPTTLVGLTVTADKLGGGGVGLTVSTAVGEAPPKVPEIVTGVATVTAVVVMEKLALSAPAATVTLAGTLATVALVLDKVTMAPPVGAAAVNVTVPVLPVPPTTLAGLTVTEDKVGAAGTGLTVSTAVRVTPPKVPEIDNAVVAVTLVVVIEKVALVAPAATVTLAGTVATAVFALLRPTTAPPAGAPAVSVTVPCDELPPTTEVGDTLTVDKLAAGGGGGAACAVKRRAAENDPATPAELMPWTRQKSCCAGKPLTVACDTVTVWLNVIGEKLFEVEIWMR